MAKYHPPPTEDDFQALLDPAALKLRREEAAEKYKDLDSGTILQLRRRCKTDLFFLCSGPLEGDLLSTDLHGHLCAWERRTRGWQHRLCLLPRGHYKSTILTVGSAIQMALPTDGLTLPYPWNLGPNIKLLLAHEIEDEASQFLLEILAAFTSKPMMLALYPELIPQPRRQRINKKEVELPRTQFWRETTFTAIGTGGRAQGKHFHWIKLDDIQGEAARESETVLNRTIDWFDNVNSLLTRPKIDGWDMVGTRWAFRDVYSHAMKVYGVSSEDSVEIDPKEFPRRERGLKVYIRGVMEDDKFIFPEEMGIEQAEVLRQNPKVWASQYANNPRKSGLQELDSAWLKYYNQAGSNLIIFDKEIGTRKINMWDGMDRIVMIDPSMGETSGSDEMGIVVTATDRDKLIFLLETIKKRFLPPDLIQLIFELNAKWHPRRISIEEVAFSSIYRYWIQEESRRLKTYPPIYPYKPARQAYRQSKESRIRGLISYFAGGQIYIRADMDRFIKEYEAFPLGAGEPGDHLLDALAQGPSLWTPGQDKGQREDARLRERKLLASRSSVTGY